MSECSEIESPSEDGNADTSHPCHPEVRLPKEYDHSTIQIRQNLNMTVNSITQYMSLYSLSFTMLLHLTNEIHEILYILVFYTFEKNTKDPETYSAAVARTSIQEPKLVHRRRSLRSSQLPWLLSKQPYASIAAHMPTRQSGPAPLTATVPKKPFKSKTATSDQTDSSKNTPKGERSTSPL